MVTQTTLLRGGSWPWRVVGCGKKCAHLRSTTVVQVAAVPGPYLHGERRKRKVKGRCVLVLHSSVWRGFEGGRDRGGSGEAMEEGREEEIEEGEECLTASDGVTRGWRRERAI